MSRTQTRTPARTLAGLPYELERVPLGKLSVHPLVQRAFRQKHAAKLAKNFDESAFDVLYVNRQGKSLYIFDGQHRKAAAEIYLGDGWEVVEVPCRIYDNLDTPTLAKLTGGKNNSLNWTAIAEFRRNVLALDPTAVAISRMLKGFGLKVREDSKPDTVRAVNALYDVYSWKPSGPELLATVVGFLHESFPDDRDALHQCMIRGTALFFLKHGDQIDRAGLLHRLRAYENATVILGKARNYAEATGISVPQAVLATLQRTYNTKRRSGRVSERSVAVA